MHILLKIITFSVLQQICLYLFLVPKKYKNLHINRRLLLVKLELKQNPGNWKFLMRLKTNMTIQFSVKYYNRKASTEIEHYDSPSQMFRIKERRGGAFFAEGKRSASGNNEK